MTVINIVVPAEPTRAQTVNERGVGGYAKFNDSYGAAISVHQSSAASGYFVWLGVRGGEANRDYPAEQAFCAENGLNWRNNEGPKFYTEASAHLCLEDAKRVRDGLTAWITDIEEQS